MDKKSAAEQRAKARMIAGAIRYADFDKSDPFTLRRCLAHIKHGVGQVARPSVPKDHQYLGEAKMGEYASYDATAYMEEQLIAKPNGDRLEFALLKYKNVVRP